MFLGTNRVLKLMQSTIYNIYAISEIQMCLRFTNYGDILDGGSSSPGNYIIASHGFVSAAGNPRFGYLIQLNFVQKLKYS
jgi:hypothetical protein